MGSPQESSEIPHVFGIHGDHLNGSFLFLWIGEPWTRHQVQFYDREHNPTCIIPHPTKRTIILQMYRCTYSMSTFAKVFLILNFIRFSQHCGLGQTGIIVPILWMRTLRVREAS